MGIRLNLACGVNLKDGWVNVDLLREGVDVERVDLTKPWPWADESAEIVYCEHFLEHLEWPKEAGRFVREALRALEPGGRLRIGVPDTQRLFHLYANTWTDEPHDAEMQEEVDRWSPRHVKADMDKAQHHLRMYGEHKWAYDSESIVALLRANGHRGRVLDSEWTKGMDSEVRRVGTLYMEAIK